MSLQARNDVESLVFSTEKSLSEHGDKISDALKEEIKASIADAKKVKDSEDVDEVRIIHLILSV